jgi:hypothetical protein
MSRMLRSLKVRPASRKNVRLSLKRNGYASQKSLVQDIGITLATISKFLTDKPVDYAYLLAILATFQGHTNQIRRLALSMNSKTVWYRYRHDETLRYTAINSTITDS